jgi:hypothetical protein
MESPSLVLAAAAHVSVAESGLPRPVAEPKTRVCDVRLPTDFQTVNSMSP